MSDLNIESLAGGYDDFTPLRQRSEDSCTIAESVEFWGTPLGARRAGTVVFPDGLPVGITGNASLGGIFWAFRHTPTQNIGDDELYVMTLDGSRNANSLTNPRLFRYRKGGGSAVWSEVSMTPADGLVVNNTSGITVFAVSFHGKLYMAFESSVDRLHVVDNGVMRRVGLAATALGPTVANGGGAGAYPATLRYYRTRSVTRSGAVVLRRSEPSVSTSFTPGGANANATVTQPAVIGEGETDWEVEASVDNISFYRLSTVAIGTTTYADTALVATYSANVLSDPIGNYTTIPSARHLTVDDDRLLTGGGYMVAADGSRVSWTPPGKDPLPGPDERFDSTVSPRIDLDALNGGNITGFALGPLAFKDSHVYGLTRTNQLIGTYDGQPITLARGALERSIIEATDESGKPIILWLDRFVGPMTYGSNGLQFAGHGLQNLWNTFTATVGHATVTTPLHGIHYARKKQAHWWVAGYKLILQLDEMRLGEHGYERGWTTVTQGNGRIASAECSVMFPRDVNPHFTGSDDLRLWPHAGFPVWTVNAAVVTDVLQQCDSGTKDGFTTGDTLAAYVAKVRSSGMQLGNMTWAFGILDGFLLGAALFSVNVKLIRDFGSEAISKNYTFTRPTSTFESQPYVAASMDELTISECRTLQVEFGDVTGIESAWQLFACVLTTSREQE